MKRAKAILDFIKFSISEKITFYYNVIAKLTGNILFTKPDVMPTHGVTQRDCVKTQHLG
jgi:hypothetical protein